jgi:hypothetical protein
MAVTFDEFYELFMATNPNLVYHEEDIQAGRTLDKILGSDLILAACRYREMELSEFKRVLEKGLSFALAKPAGETNECISYAVFLHCEFIDGVYHKHDVEYTETALQYFNGPVNS